MSTMPGTGMLRTCVFFYCVLMLLSCGVHAVTDKPDTLPDPAVYFNFNEGSGNYALDVSGHGSAGTIHGTSRIDNGGCGRALVFNGIDNYVDIPFSSQNHPDKQITVSSWFYTDTFYPQVLISGYQEGGYRLGFDDGNDLWWTVNLERIGDVSIPVQHEGISPNQWHHVTGTYDGQTSKIYLDGVLRNQVNATGAIHYQYNNYVMLGAAAGTYNRTDLACPQYFQGGLDEVRIYPIALTYGQVMDDRFRCSQEPLTPGPDLRVRASPPSSCRFTSGSLQLGAGESTMRILTFSNQTEKGIWDVTLPPGSTLVVKAEDAYSKSYPDAWYIELGDIHGRITRSIAFPNTINTPVEGIIPSGNATVLVHYFDGKERFPAQVIVQFESITPPPQQIVPLNILANPIIVIYTASWATLIALIVVIFWLHKRKRQQ